MRPLSKSPQRPSGRMDLAAKQPLKRRQPVVRCPNSKPRGLRRQPAGRLASTRSRMAPSVTLDSTPDRVARVVRGYGNGSLMEDEAARVLDHLADRGS